MMPMSFPDMESLRMAAEIWKFRPPTARAMPPTAPRSPSRRYRRTWPAGAAFHSGEGVEARTTMGPVLPHYGHCRRRLTTARSGVGSWSLRFGVPEDESEVSYL